MPKLEPTSIKHVENLEDGLYFLKPTKVRATDIIVIDPFPVSMVAYPHRFKFVLKKEGSKGILFVFRKGTVYRKEGPISELLPFIVEKFVRLRGGRGPVEIILKATAEMESIPLQEYTKIICDG